MSLLLFKSAATSTILATSLLGVWFAKNMRVSQRFVKLGESFTSGIFLGLALFHMLPDSESGFHTLTASSTQAYPLIFLLCSLSFLILLIIELTLTKFNYNAISYLLMLILSSHSILAGAALGSYINIKPALILFIAIILHKGLASFALATKLFNQIKSEKQRNLLLSIFVLMTPTGIIIASAINSLLQTEAGLILESTLNALAAGAFLYLGTWHKMARDIYMGRSEKPWLDRGVMCLGLFLLLLLQHF